MPSTPPAPKLVQLDAARAASGATQADEEPAGRHRGAGADSTVSVSALLAAAGLEPSQGRAARRRAEEIDVVVPMQARAPRAEEIETADTETLRPQARVIAVVTPSVTRATWTPEDDDAAVTDLVARPGAEPGGGPVPGVLGLVVGLLALAGAVALAIPGSLGALTEVADSIAAVVAVLGVALLGGTCAAIGVAPRRRARPAALLGLIASGLAVLMVALPMAALYVL